MVLVDTSVWVDHFRNVSSRLGNLLTEGQVACHPFIIGELVCSNLKNRAEIFSLLTSLPKAVQADHNEVMGFIEAKRLMGKGIGFMDIHLHPLL